MNLNKDKTEETPRKIKAHLNSLFNQLNLKSSNQKQKNSHSNNSYNSIFNEEKHNRTKSDLVYDSSFTNNGTIPVVGRQIDDNCIISGNANSKQFPIQMEINKRNQSLKHSLISNQLNHSHFEYNEEDVVDVNIRPHTNLSNFDANRSNSGIKVRPLSAQNNNTNQEILVNQFGTKKQKKKPNQRVSETTKVNQQIDFSSKGVPLPNSTQNISKGNNRFNRRLDLQTPSNKENSLFIDNNLSSIHQETIVTPLTNNSIQAMSAALNTHNANQWSEATVTQGQDNKSMNIRTNYGDFYSVQDTLYSPLNIGQEFKTRQSNINSVISYPMKSTIDQDKHEYEQIVLKAKKKLKSKKPKLKPKQAILPANANENQNPNDLNSSIAQIQNATQSQKVKNPQSKSPNGNSANQETPAKPKAKVDESFELSLQDIQKLIMNSFKKKKIHDDKFKQSQANLKNEILRLQNKSRFNKNQEASLQEIQDRDLNQEIREQKQAIKNDKTDPDPQKAIENRKQRQKLYSLIVGQVNNLQKKNQIATSKVNSNNRSQSVTRQAGVSFNSDQNFYLNSSIDLNIGAKRNMKRPLTSQKIRSISGEFQRRSQARGGWSSVTPVHQNYTPTPTPPLPNSTHYLHNNFVSPQKGNQKVLNKGKQPIKQFLNTSLNPLDNQFDGDMSDQNRINYKHYKKMIEEIENEGNYSSEKRKQNGSSLTYCDETSNSRPPSSLNNYHQFPSQNNSRQNIAHSLNQLNQIQKQSRKRATNQSIDERRSPSFNNYDIQSAQEDQNGYNQLQQNNQFEHNEEGKNGRFEDSDDNGSEGHIQNDIYMNSTRNQQFKLVEGENQNSLDYGEDQDDEEFENEQNDADENNLEFEANRRNQNQGHNQRSSFQPQEQVVDFEQNNGDENNFDSNNEGYQEEENENFQGEYYQQEEIFGVGTQEHSARDNNGIQYQEEGNDDVLEESSNSNNNATKINCNQSKNSLKIYYFSSENYQIETNQSRYEGNEQEQYSDMSLSEAGPLTELVEMSSSNYTEKDMQSKSSRSSNRRIINDMETFDVEVNRGLPINEIKKGNYLEQMERKSEMTNQSLAGRSDEILISIEDQEQIANLQEIRKIESDAQKRLIEREDMNEIQQKFDKKQKNKTNFEKVGNMNFKKKKEPQNEDIDQVQLVQFEEQIKKIQQCWRNFQTKKLLGFYAMYYEGQDQNNQSNQARIFETEKKEENQKVNTVGSDSFIEIDESLLDQIDPQLIDEEFFNSIPLQSQEKVINYLNKKYGGEAQKSSQIIPNNKWQDSQPSSKADQKNSMILIEEYNPDQSTNQVHPASQKYDEKKNKQTQQEIQNFSQLILNDSQLINNFNNNEINFSDFNSEFDESADSQLMRIQQGLNLVEPKKNDEEAFFNQYDEEIKKSIQQTEKMSFQIALQQNVQPFVSAPEKTVNTEKLIHKVSEMKKIEDAPQQNQPKVPETQKLSNNSKIQEKTQESQATKETKDSIDPLGRSMEMGNNNSSLELKLEKLREDQVQKWDTMIQMLQKIEEDQNLGSHAASFMKVLKDQSEMNKKILEENLKSTSQPDLQSDKKSSKVEISNKPEKESLNPSNQSKHPNTSTHQQSTSQVESLIKETKIQETKSQNKKGADLIAINTEFEEFLNLQDLTNSNSSSTSNQIKEFLENKESSRHLGDIEGAGDIKRNQSQSSIFDENPFVEFSKQHVKEILHQDNMMKLLQIREQALDQRYSAQDQMMKKMLDRNRISPQSYNSKRIELEQWVTQEKENIQMTKSELEKSWNMTYDTIRKTQRDLKFYETMEQRRRDSIYSDGMDCVFKTQGSLEDDDIEGTNLISEQNQRTLHRRQNNPSVVGIQNSESQTDGSASIKNLQFNYYIGSPKSTGGGQENIKVIDDYKTSGGFQKQKDEQNSNLISGGNPHDSANSCKWSEQSEFVQQISFQNHFLQQINNYKTEEGDDESIQDLLPGDIFENQNSKNKVLAKDKSLKELNGVALFDSNLREPNSVKDNTNKNFTKFQSGIITSNGELAISGNQENYEEYESSSIESHSNSGQQSNSGSQLKNQRKSQAQTQEKNQIIDHRQFIDFKQFQELNDEDDEKFYKNQDDLVNGQYNEDDDEDPDDRLFQQFEIRQIIEQNSNNGFESKQSTGNAKLPYNQIPPANSPISNDQGSMNQKYFQKAESKDSVEQKITQSLLSIEPLSVDEQIDEYNDMEDHFGWIGQGEEHISNSLTKQTRIPNSNVDSKVTSGKSRNFDDYKKLADQDDNLSNSGDTEPPNPSNKTLGSSVIKIGQLISNSSNNSDTKATTSNQIDHSKLNENLKQVAITRLHQERADLLTDLMMEILLFQFQEEIQRMVNPVERLCAASRNRERGIIQKQSVINVKPVEDKQKPRGIKTNLTAVKQYMNRLSNFILQKSKEQFMRKINSSVGPSPKEMLKLLHYNDTESSQLSSSTDSLYQNQAILTTEIYGQLQQVLGIQKLVSNNLEPYGQNLARAEFLKEIQHIHNQVIFDSYNQALDWFRLYGLRGQPFPWKVSTFQLSEKQYSQPEVPKVLEKAKDKVVEWATSLCGIILDQEDSPFSHGLMMDQDYVAQIQEDRLARMLAIEVVETEDRWITYDDEHTEVMVELSDLVFDRLMNETVDELLLVLFKKSK